MTSHRCLNTSCADHERWTTEPASNGITRSMPSPSMTMRQTAACFPPRYCPLNLKTSSSAHIKTPVRTAPPCSFLTFEDRTEPAGQNGVWKVGENLGCQVGFLSRAPSNVS